ncbi:MAG: penicillin acylase family protein, partial [Ferruginibacter sp.]|nr:penicillin acylase family protein [Cytophagales bacterium]
MRRNACLVVLTLLFGLVGYAQLDTTRRIDPGAVTIARDAWGVPHIFAKTDPEVAYGLAWAHAEDDFQTIQLPLLAGKAMLGRLKGKSGAAADYVVQLLRCRELAEARYEADLSPEFKALLEGY